MGTTVTVTVMDEALEQTTVTCEVGVVTDTLKHNDKKTLQRKTATIIILPMTKYMLSMEEC